MSLSGDQSEQDPIRESTSPELRSRLARVDAASQRELAELLAPRVRRVARAFMGKGRDADDAAHEVLIELLRAHAEAAGARSVERWADRRAALSVLRFARAVRRRGGDPAGKPSRVDNAPARTFDHYLEALQETSREVLLLRHALSFAVAELPEALCCSRGVAQDRLRNARRELRALVRRRGGQQELGARARRWCELRDREALEDPLTDSEREEVAQLEANEPEVWAFVAQVRALELYFASQARILSDADSALVEAALPAVQMTSETAVARALQGRDDWDRTSDGEEGRLARAFSIAGSAALLGGCLVALMLREPAPAQPAQLAEHPELEGASNGPVQKLAPTVQSLTSARLIAGRAHDGDRLLQQGRALRELDVVESFDRPTCLRIDTSDLCLAAHATVRIDSLVAGAPEIALLQGRLTVRARVPMKLHARGLTMSLAGAAAALEQSDDGELVTARALEGSVELEGASVASARDRVFAGTAVSFCPATQTRLLSTLTPHARERDWELFTPLGTGLARVRPPVARASATPTETPAPSDRDASEVSRAAPEPAPSELSSAERLLRELESEPDTVPPPTDALATTPARDPLKALDEEAGDGGGP